MRQTDKWSSSAILALERGYPKQWAEAEPLTCCPPRLSVFWVGWLAAFWLSLFPPSGHGAARAFFGGDVHHRGRKEEDISTWLNFPLLSSPLLSKVDRSDLPFPLPPSVPRSRSVPSRMFSHMDTSSAAACHSIRWRKERGTSAATMPTAAA